MTTPGLDDLELPYTVTFYPATGVLMYPDTGQRGDWPSNYLQHRLGPGAYLLQVTYYSNGADLRLFMNRPNISGMHTLFQFPSGEAGWLSSHPVSVSVPQGSEMFLRLQSNGGFGDNRQGVTAAITVYPMPIFTP